MTPERWRQIEDLYHAARERVAANRAGFLDEACGGDADLRREVESLLAEEDGSRAALIETPVLTNDAGKTGAGSQFGPYRIEASIGRGGMGEVWKARDSRLNRDVAIKISAQQFTRRFEREARAIAALNHPNICTLYDIGPNYLVMELVEGPTLAERIKRGPIPVDEALAIAKQIASALGAAHDKGIVHRDLKPANIKIRPDGSVKVLDFGLAKASGEEAGISPDSQTMAMTAPGAIMGTPGYMPPEQVRGEKVDERADIWAFGVVLYEMVTGQRAFEGKTASDTLASVIKEDPDWQRAPVNVRRLLQRCLEKDPSRRLRDISGVEFLLEEGASTAFLRSRLGAAGSVVAAVFAIVAGALGFVHFREKLPEAKVTRLTMSLPEKYRFPRLQAAVSPDGRQVAFRAVSPEGTDQLWLRPLDSLMVQPLAGTENASFPFWSPDSRSLGFFASGKLKTIPVLGGPATTLADATDARGGTWSQNDVIVFAPTPNAGLLQVSASGGVTRPVTAVNGKGTTQLSQRYPWFLPDGRHFIYMLGGSGFGAVIRIGSLNSPTEDRVLDKSADSLAVYAEGYLLYRRGNTLMARPLDVKRFAVSGEAVPVAEHVNAGGLNGAGNFAVSSAGVLVCEAELKKGVLAWLDRSGKPAGTLGETGNLGEVSPNGNTIADFSPDVSGNVDIWLYDVLQRLRSRFTFDPAQDELPVWSPDGATIVFASNRKGVFDLYRRPADGSRKEELVWADNLLKHPGSFSPDGKYLAYRASGDPEMADDIWILPDPLGTPGASKAYTFMQTKFKEGDPQFSPDGRWMAYVSDESGRNEVYVAPFPGPGPKRQVSAAGGGSVRWRRDGKELFYAAPDNRVMAAEVNAKGSVFEVKKVAPLFGLPSGVAAYDVSADGQRFLVTTPPESDTAQPLTVVLDWTAGLKK